MSLFVYLAGPILGEGLPDWRKSFRAKLTESIPDELAVRDIVTLMEPGAAIGPELAGPRDPQMAFEVYGPADRISLDLADVVVGFMPDVNSLDMGGSYGLGTAAELGYARARNTPILGIISGTDDAAMYHWRFLLGFLGASSAPTVKKAAAMVAQWALQAAGETRRGK